jgi:hypothetical protein
MTATNFSHPRKKPFKKVLFGNNRVELAKMESLYRIPFSFLQCPHIKLKKPSWVKQPSPMFVFSLVLLSYFLVTGGLFDFM